MGDRDTFQIWFSYFDPDIAQKVNARLAVEVITEHSRSRLNQATSTLQFLNDTRKAAAAEWEERIAAVIAAQRTGKSIHRADLDAQIARQRYESLSAKVWEADVLRSLEERHQGPSLEVLDAASRPNEVRPTFVQSAAGGLIVGALLAWLLSTLAGALRPRRQAVQSV